jgi:hypothetical protein
MNALTQVIDGQIEALEEDLRSDPRFRELLHWRALKDIHGGTEPVASKPAALEAPVQKAARTPRAAPMKKAKVLKPAKKQRAPSTPRASSDETEQYLDAILQAIVTLQIKKKQPTFAAIQAKAKCKAYHVVRGLKALIESGRIEPQGGRQDRTYLIHGDTARAAAEPTDDAEVDEIETVVAGPDAVNDEPESDEQGDDEPEVLAPPREATALPDDFDIHDLSRAQREVLLACRIAGDNVSVSQIAPYADIHEERVPMVLTALNGLGLASHHAGKWSLTDLGYSAATALRAEKQS